MKEEVTVNQRLINAINELKNNGISQNKGIIYSKIGYNSGYLRDISRKNMTASDEFICKLLKYYPVNPKYIYDGEEPILLKHYASQVDTQNMGNVINNSGDGNVNSIGSANDSVDSVYKSRISDMEETIRVQRETIDKLQDQVDRMTTILENIVGIMKK